MVGPATRNVAGTVRGWVAGRLAARGRRTAAYRLDPTGAQTLAMLGLPTELVALDEGSTGTLRALALALLGRLPEADAAAPSQATDAAANRAIALAGGAFSPEWALRRLQPGADCVRAALYLALDRLDDARAEWTAARPMASSSDAAAFDSALAAAAADHATARARLNDALQASGMRRVVPGDDAPLSLASLSRSVAQRSDDPRLVTIVICVRDMAGTVEAAMRSCLAQSHAAIELLVVDDGSSDRTAGIVAALAAADRRIRVLPGAARAGLFTARNIGLRAARGGFVTFHDADDWMHPYRIEKSLEVLDRSPASLGAVFNLLRLDDRGRICAPRIWPMVRRSNASMFLRLPAVLDRIGAFEEVRVGADDEYLDRIVLREGSRALRRSREIVMLAHQTNRSLTGDPVVGISSPSGAELRAGYRSCWMRRHTGLPAPCEHPDRCTCGNAIC